MSCWLIYEASTGRTFLLVGGGNSIDYSIVVLHFWRPAPSDVRGASHYNISTRAHEASYYTLLLSLHQIGPYSVAQNGYFGLTSNSGVLYIGKYFVCVVSFVDACHLEITTSEKRALQAESNICGLWILVQPINIFKSSNLKLVDLFCHISVKRDLRALLRTLENTPQVLLARRIKGIECLEKCL